MLDSIFSPPLANKRVLLIDLDGTLADSHTHLYPIYLDFLKFYGVKGSYEEFKRLSSPPLEMVIQQLKENHGLQDSCSSMQRLYEKLLRERYLKKVRLKPHARDFLKRAYENGIALYLCTSNFRDISDSFLKKKGVAPLFSGLFCGDDGPLNKLEPAYFSSCLKSIQVPAAEALLIDDSQAVIEKAAMQGLEGLIFCSKNPKVNTPVMHSWKEVGACIF